MLVSINDEETNDVMESRLVSDVRPCDRTPRQVAHEFRALVAAGAQLRPAGLAKRDPSILLKRGYVPRYRLRLFDTLFFLPALRQEPNARFFIAWVMLDANRDVSPRKRTLFPRYFYKDASLVWRSASHFARSETENWIGKGDLKPVLVDGEEILYSAEETTNLPLEIQIALDDVSRMTTDVKRDDAAIGLVLRRAPDDRVAPYRDFTAPRERAARDRRNRIHGGAPVAWFTRKNDPASLRFARGFEPDFERGMLDTGSGSSRLYGGEVRKVRVVSTNRVIQWQFVATPSSCWVVPPQALTTELSSYGVRTVDVEAPEELCVPGYEYHYLDDSQDPPQLYSQIPAGFAGEISTVDPARADASPWLDQLPVIQQFRRAIGFPTRVRASAKRKSW